LKLIELRIIQATAEEKAVATAAGVSIQSVSSAGIVTFKQLLNIAHLDIRKRHMSAFKWYVCTERSSSDITSLLERSFNARQAAQDQRRVLGQPPLLRDPLGREISADPDPGCEAAKLVAPDHELLPINARFICRSKNNKCWVIVGSTPFIYVDPVHGRTHHLGRRAQYVARTDENELLSEESMDLYLESWKFENGFSAVHLSTVTNSMVVV
jgi:hypothetical protein